MSDLKFFGDGRARLYLSTLRLPSRKYRLKSRVFWARFYYIKELSVYRGLAGGSVYDTRNYM